MYSEHGFDALIRPDRGVVCQRLIVVSYWMPGSAHSQAAVAISRISARADTVSTTSPPVTDRRSHGPSATTAAMKSSVTRTELFAFWYCAE